MVGGRKKILAVENPHFASICCQVNLTLFRPNMDNVHNYGVKAIYLALVGYHYIQNTALAVHVR